MNIDRDILLRMSKDAMSALDIGKAAEHIVCADLILRGYRCYLSDQGLPYDAVVDVNGRLIRVQVKSTCFVKNVNPSGKKERLAYGWDIRSRGRRRRSRLNDSHCDVVALVALDIGIVAYLPLVLCAQGLRLLPPGADLGTEFKSGSRWARTIADFPFEEAIGGDITTYKAIREVTHCLRGHEYTPENTKRTKKGSPICVECYRMRSRDSARRISKKRKEKASDAAPQLVL